MARKYTELTFTPSVKAAQEHYGARSSAAKVESWSIEDQRLSAIESDFIEQRDSFYMATVNEAGWPYVQHRGGPPGFLKVIDDQTFGFADFRGNRQYISAGNLRHDDRAALFLMDYAHRRRLKLMVRSESFDVDKRPDLADLIVPEYGALTERYVLFHVVAFDWNCPQHITPRLTEAEWNSRS